LEFREKEVHMGFGEPMGNRYRKGMSSRDGETREDRNKPSMF
jgi:hypothetical protein